MLIKKYWDSLPAWARRVLKWFVGPALLYLLIWAVYTWPTMQSFSSHFFADDGDGLQNVWNIWWVNKTATQLHTLPYFTNYLHAPDGVTLIGQTMNPFNGYVAILLLPFLSLTQAHNVMYLFAFVTAGVFAMWLAYAFTKSYWLSFIGGFLFTFSTYHWSHGMGHLQMTSLEFIPLFLLVWWRLLNRPKPWLAVSAAAILFLVLLCDHYYYFYSILAAIIMAAYVYLFTPRKQVWLKQRVLPAIIFGLVALGLTGPLMINLVRASKADPFLGSHDAIRYSADLLSAISYSPPMRWSEFNQAMWTRLNYSEMEGHVYLGLATIAVIAIGLLGWKKLKGTQLPMWYAIALFFGVMSLGPRLHVNGVLYDNIKMPYQLMEILIPSLKLSGVPVRNMVMVTVAGAVIVPMVLQQAKKWTRYAPYLFALFLVVLVLESWPKPNYLTSNSYPAYAYALKDLPAGNVIDLTDENQNQVLYYQTLHEKPLAFGSISRTPISVQYKIDKLHDRINENNYDALCHDWHFSYLVLPKEKETPLAKLYSGDDATIYLLGEQDACSAFK